MTYNPDNWVVLFINGKDPHYRILAGWSGGYTTGTSWKLNSGITSVEEVGDYLDFKGSSGSVYRCHKEGYGLRMNNAYIFNQLKTKYQDKVEMLDEETNWLTMDWVLNESSS